jgi:hypothetical protein
MEAVIFPMQHLPFDRREARRFIFQKFRDGEIKTIRRTAHMQSGECYENVKAVMRERGGSLQAGWIFCWIPGKLIKALHHAVLRNDDGGLEDVTTWPFPLMTNDAYEFIEDNEITIDRFNPSVASIFEPLSKNMAVRAFIEAATEVMNLRKERIDLLREFEREHGVDSVVFLPNGECGLRVHPPSALIKINERIEEATQRKRLAVKTLSVD